MADFGSVAILVKLMGGQDVLKQLQEIRKVAKELESKPINLRVTTSDSSGSGNNSLEREIQRAEAAAKKAEGIREREAKAFEKSLQDAEKGEQRKDAMRGRENSKNEANLAKQIALGEKTAKSAEQVAEREAKAYEKSVAAQAAGFQRAQAAREKNMAAYQASVEKQALGFQRAFGDVTKDGTDAQAARIAGVNNLLNGLSSGLTKVGGMWSGAIAGITKFSDGLTHAGQVAATFAYRMTIISAPFDILIAKSLQFTTQLELSLAKVGTQLDTTADKMRTFTEDAKAQILGLQSTYGVGGLQQSDALYKLISSNIEEKQAIASLEPITKLAAVAQANAGVIAQGLVAAFNVFGDELSGFATDTERATYSLNVMFEASKKGRFEFEDFATQFGRSAEMAHMAGMSFDETAAALASLSQVFTPSQASTTLNSFAKAFTQPAEKAKAAFNDLGVKMYETMDGVTKRRPFIDVFEDTFDALSNIQNIDAAKLDEAMSALFGDLRGGRGAMFFLDPKNRTVFQDVLKQIRSGTDSIGEGWKLTSEQIQTQINIVIGKFLELGDKMVTFLKPAIKGGLEGLKALFDGLAANPAMIATLTQFGAAMAIAAPAALALGTALMGVGGIISAIATLMTPAYLIGFAIVWEQIAPAIGKASDAVNAFGGGLTGIIATVTEFARQMGLISSTDADKIFESLGVTYNLAGFSAVKDLVDSLKSLAPDVNALRDGIMGIADGVALLIKNIGEGKGILGFFANTVKTIGEGLVGLSEKGGGASGIAGTLDLVIGGALVAKIGGAIVGALAKLVVGVQNVTAGQVNILGFKSPNLPPQAPGVLSTLGGGSAVRGAGAFAAAGLTQQAAQGGAKSILDTLWEDDGILSTILKQSLAFLSSIPINPSFGVSFAVGIQDLIRNTGNSVIGILNDQFKLNLPNLTVGLDEAIRVFKELPKNLSILLGLGVDSALAKIEIPDISDSIQTIVNTLATAINRYAVDIANQALSVFGMPSLKIPYGFGASKSSPSFGGSFPDPYLFPKVLGSSEAGAKSFAYRDDARVVNRFTEGLSRGDGILSGFNTAADKASDALKTLNDSLNGLIKAALAPTSVTEEQVKRIDLEKKLANLRSQLAQTEGKPNQRRRLESEIGDAERELGGMAPYTDQPDEFARRTRAVASGTDAATYGAKYQQQLALAQSKMPGATPEQIAGAFDDKSLFAKMSLSEISQMWDWDAVVGNVKQGIARIVGEFKTMKVAIKEVLAGLSKTDLSELSEALGLTGVGIEGLSGAVLGKLGFGGADTVGGVGGVVADDTMEQVSALEGLLQSIQSNAIIDIKVNWNIEAFEVAKGFILEAEKFILDKLAKYADIFISITARFSDESGTPPTPPGGVPQPKAEGGYIGKGIYEVGELGTEYVLPNELVTWLEKILGGKIESPNQLKWLVESLARNSLLKDAPDWATMMGADANLPGDSQYWASHIKVKTGSSGSGDALKGKFIQSYGSYLTALNGTPTSTGGGGGGSSGGSGEGTGIGGDVSAILDRLTNTLDRLTQVMNLLMNRLNSASAMDFSSVGGGSYAVAGGGTGGGNGGMNFYGNITFQVPNGATLAGIQKDLIGQARLRANAAHGRD